MHSQRAQSTVEYILLVAAVIAVVITITATKQGSIQKGLNNVFETTTTTMINVADTLAQATHSK